MELLPHHSEPFPTEPGIHWVDPHLHADKLFELDCSFASSGSMIPFDTPPELIAFLTEEHHSDTFILNDQTGLAVGCLSIIDAPPHALEVLSVGVRPEHQGKGHGATMMRWAEDIAAQNGRQSIQLVAKVANTNGVAFYNRLGYTEVERIDDHYGDGEPRRRFEKHLG